MTHTIYLCMFESVQKKLVCIYKVQEINSSSKSCYMFNNLESFWTHSCLNVRHGCIEIILAILLQDHWLEFVFKVMTDIYENFATGSQYVIPSLYSYYAYLWTFCIIIWWDSQINTQERFGCNFQRQNIHNFWHTHGDRHHYNVTSKCCGITIMRSSVQWMLTFLEINAVFNLLKKC